MNFLNCINQTSYHLYLCIGKREIKALRSKCDSVERGCEWEGTVGTLEEHVATCDFTPVPCPKECKQNDTIQMILRKDLEKHLKEQCMNRDYICQYCGKKDTFTSIKYIHDDICEKKILICPSYECMETMERSEIRKHLEFDCEYLMLPCKYKKIGCDVKMKRKNMGAHEQDDKEHLHQALDTVVKLQERKLIAKSITFQVTEYEKKKESDKVYSALLSVGYSTYNIGFNVYPNGIGLGKGTHVSVFIPILKGNYDDKLSWPFIGTVKVEILNQLEDKNHRVAILTFKEEHNARVGYSRGWTKFTPHSLLSYDPVNNTQHLKDDTLYFRVSVEVEGHKPWLECTVLTQEEIIEEVYYMKAQMQSVTNTIASNNATIVKLKKENEDMAVKLQSATDTTAKLQSTIASVKKESAAMAAQWKKEKDDMALKFHNTCTTMQSAMASMKTENAVMAAQWKKENEDMAVKLHSTMSTIASLCGDSTTFKLTEFSKKMANDEAFHSKSFYSICGYNISIAVYPNGHGDGKGTHVALFAHVVEGDYDNQLQWPFIGTVKVELLNQLEDKNHNYATLPFYEEDNTRVVGYNGFISHSQLSNIPRKIQYLRGDTLYFRASVEDCDYKPWLECTK